MTAESSLKKEYNNIMRACFIAYVIQAIVNNFIPLLFVTFEREYGINLTKITFLITINFALQIFVDFFSAYIIPVIGYKIAIIAAHVFSAAGLILMSFLPDLLGNPFVGLLICISVYAIGSGLIEVAISPVVNACPSDNKEAAMSLLHSFYCWGHAITVLLSVIYFKLFSINNWRILALLWAIVPIVNMIPFVVNKFDAIEEHNDGGMTVTELLKNRLFYVLLLMMICSGASEQAVSQWASAFAEQGLHVSKMVGDILGPMCFAITMGTSRAIFGKVSDKINLNKYIVLSCILCVISFMVVVFAKNPMISLVGCMMTGFSVGIMWPGTYTKAATAIPDGKTSLFAILALGGDVGCASGPTLAGIVSGHFNDNLRYGILAAVIFPVTLLLCVFLLKKKKKI